MTNRLQIIICFLCCMGIVFPVTSNSMNTVEEITLQKLAKKWKLEKYSVFFISEDPEEKEQNDYMYLKADMTFDSVSEGVFEQGKWRLDVAKERIYLSQQGQEGELILIIEELSEEELVVTIDDDSYEDASYLKIHFTTKK